MRTRARRPRRPLGCHANRHGRWRADGGPHAVAAQDCGWRASIPPSSHLPPRLRQRVACALISQIAAGNGLVRIQIIAFKIRRPLHSHRDATTFGRHRSPIVTKRRAAASPLERENHRRDRLERHVTRGLRFPPALQRVLYPFRSPLWNALRGSCRMSAAASAWTAGGTDETAVVPPGSSRLRRACGSNRASMARCEAAECWPRSSSC